MKACSGCMIFWLAPCCLGLGGSLNLPEPPHQRTPWRAPVALPTNLLSAVKTVFAQGFPDPRGCEYREIEIVTSSVWEGRTNATATRGWVLPQKAGAARFAIAWNGLIYPVLKVGEVADLRAEAGSLEAGRSTGRMYFSGLSERAVGESRSVFLATAPSTRVLLLLRAGETAAALTNFARDHQSAFNARALPLLRAEKASAALTISPADRQSASRPRAPGSTRTDASAASYDPYLQFAGDWAWALFDRLINAHMRGDEALALATARTLAGVQPRIEAEAARRGFARQPYYDSARRGKEKPYLDFLEQFPELLADLERREREGPRVSTLARGLANIANPRERIAALIRDLDLVAARQMSQPGWVVPAEDPIVAALIAEGDPAVEPLLHCLETDKRLTRSVGFGRDFFRGRTVLPVSSAARHALLAILQANFGSAAEMRAYWGKYGAMEIHERWYAILRDDGAGIGRWLEAAGLMTQPANEWSVPGTGYSRQWPAPTNAHVGLRGEPLRAKSNPSVAELLARRALEIGATNLAGYDLATACELGLRLAKWDAPSAGPVASALAERCLAVAIYSEPPRALSGPPVAGFIARLTGVRAIAGDRRAFTDYAQWLETETPEKLGGQLAESLQPLRQFHTNDLLRVTAEHLFSETNSAWGKLPWKGSGSFNPAESELVSVPAFRRLLARELDRNFACGHAEYRAPNWVSFTVTNQVNQNIGHTFASSGNEQPVVGAKVELRWSDWIALSLAKAKAIPAFNPFAPVAQREQAIQDAKAVLCQPVP